MFTLAVLAFAAPVASQTVVGPEIGVQGGLTRWSDNNGDGITIISLPAHSYPVAAMGYATFFTPSHTAIEPQLGYTYVSNGDGVSRIAFAMQLMQFSKANAAPQNSAYGLINAGIVGAFGSGGSDSSFQLGAGAGYRIVVRKTLGLRFEARYRRWFDSPGGFNEITIGVGMGAILGEK